MLLECICIASPVAVSMAAVPLASSSRSQVAAPTASAAGGVTWERSSVGVRWRPRLAVAIVTQLVTRVLVAALRSGASLTLMTVAYKEAWRFHEGPSQAA